eukprot:TRINITY_DN10010_c0_g1_i1.p2 TRINITY_DN10010_c0_g1~~TRINITY_DN10010_c0_g1_i1.p2  ORF type:complete len:150 (-),score=33.81 TRINITY_DN10010_c0_g1_i1:275-724(-)
MSYLYCTTFFSFMRKKNKELLKTKPIKKENKSIKEALACPSALILVPTRELAEQVYTQVNLAAKSMKWLRTGVIFGGTGNNLQAKYWEGAEVIVATTGRLLSLISSKKISLDLLKILVVDECDRMFNFGFFPDIQEIFRKSPDAASKKK